MENEHRYLDSLTSKQGEKINLEGSFHRKKGGFAAFLICVALLIAVLAVSMLWIQKGGEDWFRGLGSVLGDPSGEQTPNTDPSHTDTPSHTDPPAEDSPIPSGATPISGKDLSSGTLYIENESAFSPNLDMLREMSLDHFAVSGEPLVLILHTHTSESYLPNGTRYVEGAVGDAVRSEDESTNVLSVGKVLAQALNSRGIATVHCEVMHDASGLGGSYQCAAESIRRYLALYPSIRYVIDLHRDCVMTEDGALIRSVGSNGGESVAQVRAVVGTDGSGASFEDGWEKNLAFALQLSDRLAAHDASVSRPVKLCQTSLNQELAAYSLLLEIGTAANSPGEAERAAVLVGKALADMIQEP